MEDKFKGFKKGYKTIFTLPSKGKIYAALAAASLIDIAFSALMGTGSLNVAYSLAVTLLIPHMLFLCNRRVFTLKRVGGLSLFTLILDQPLILGAGLVEASLLVLLVTSVVCTTIYSRKTGTGLLVLTLIISVAGGVLDAAVTAATVSAVIIYFYRIDSRIRKAAGVSGLEFLNTFFHYILGGYKEAFEKYLEKISEERTLSIHVYSFTTLKGDRVADIVVSEIHPGPFRRVGSSELSQRLMQRPIPTIFLKAPASHGENLASSSYIDGILGKLESLDASPSEGLASASHIEGSVINTFTLRFSNAAPPLVLCDPQVPLEDLPRDIIEETPAVVADLHSLIDSNYLVLVPGSSIYLEALQQILNGLLAGGPAGGIEAAALHIEYSDHREVAEGGITLLALKTGNQDILIAGIDGNNMDPRFKAEAQKMLKKTFTHVLLATTDTHVYSGAFTRVEYLPVGTRRREELLKLLARAAPKIASSMQPVKVAYSAVPVKAPYTSKEKLERISLETEKNLRDGVKIMAILVLYPLALLFFKYAGYFLPLLVDHFLKLLYVAL